MSTSVYKLFANVTLAQEISFGAYQLLERVGKGGMAAVYRAYRRGIAGFNKQVAIKMLLPNLADQTQFVALFTREARLSACLYHPNIVQVHDFGLVDGLPFLEMEWLDGVNLRQLLGIAAREMRPLRTSVVLAIGRDLLEGLSEAHGHCDNNGQPEPIIHRDISPSNVMICRDGTSKLLDFGVAKLLSPDGEFSNVSRGKLAYMAPEQLRSPKVDPRTDVFSVGVVLYEALTGRRLFGPGTDAEVIKRLTELRYAPPSVYNSDIPDWAEDMVLKALSKDPADRFQSATEMVEGFYHKPEIASARDVEATLVSVSRHLRAGESSHLRRVPNDPPEAPTIVYHPVYDSDDSKTLDTPFPRKLTLDDDEGPGTPLANQIHQDFASASTLRIRRGGWLRNAGLTMLVFWGCLTWNLVRHRTPAPKADSATIMPTPAVLPFIPNTNSAKIAERTEAAAPELGLAFRPTHPKATVKRVLKRAPVMRTPAVQASAKDTSQILDPFENLE